jgi:hypothetical protein
VLDAIDAATFEAAAASPYEQEIARAVQRVYVDSLMRLAGTAEMAQVRAIASQRLRQRMTDSGKGQGQAHAELLAADIKRFLDRPAPPMQTIQTPQAPPGAPIGEPAMDWLGRLEPLCTIGLEDR